MAVFLLCSIFHNNLYLPIFSSPPNPPNPPNLPSPSNPPSPPTPMRNFFSYAFPFRLDIPTL